jgi:hypothetical protein
MSPLCGPTSKLRSRSRAERPTSGRSAVGVPAALDRRATADGDDMPLIHAFLDAVVTASWLSWASQHSGYQRPIELPDTVTVP